MLEYALKRFSKFSISPQETVRAEDKIRALQSQEHKGAARKSEGLKLEVSWERDEVKRETRKLTGKMAELGSSGDMFGAPAHPYTQRLLASTPRLRHRVSRGRGRVGILA